MIVTINSGSTSIKLDAFEPPTLERIHAAQQSGSNLDATDVLHGFLRALPPSPIAAMAHRVVHGGTLFSRPTRLDETVLGEIEKLSELAPLHNPAALHWIAAARELAQPQTLQLAVFDTAFFTPLPPVAAHYAVPESLRASQSVRRYGFHGIAHEAMWRRWCELNRELPQGGRLISLQLGGGCSIAATCEGRPLDTSMGFSPLEGLVMATRSGDIDPAVIPFLEKRLKITAEEIVARLNRESGLRGVSQRSANLSELLSDPSADAQLAVDLYCYRARKYIGAFLAVLGGCDGIVFGGGVGEHVPQARARILQGLEWAGIELDTLANQAATRGEGRISRASSRVSIYVLPADEALSLAQAALALMRPDLPAR